MATPNSFVSLVALTLLLLCHAPPPHAARPAPTPNHLQQDLEAQPTESELLDDICHGIGEQECLVRRTLAAHLDYVYTQKHHHP